MVTVNQIIRGKELLSSCVKYSSPGCDFVLAHSPYKPAGQMAGQLISRPTHSLTDLSTEWVDLLAR